MGVWPEQAAALYDVAETSVSVAGTGGRATLLAADPQRIAVCFTASQGGCTASTKSTSTAGQGILMASTGQPTILTFNDVGPLVQQPWFAFNNAGTATTVGIFAVSLKRHELDGVRLG